MNYSEREHFKAHSERGAQFYIGPIIIGKISEKYKFSISRRVNGKNGEFLGIIVAAIETENYAEFLKYLDIGRGSAVTIFRTDGALILRQPMQHNLLGKTFRCLIWSAMLANEQQSGIYEADGIDGLRRLVAYRKIERLPLIAVTSVPANSILNGWRRRVKMYSAVSIAMFFALIALAIFSSDPLSFDLVITDQSMPSLSGMDLARELLTIRPDIPIILCTGHSVTASPETAQKAGIRQFLMKPVVKQELARVIRHVLDETPEMIDDPWVWH